MIATPHTPAVRPVVKLDAPEGLYRGICSCGWESQGVEHEPAAMKSAERHAEARRKNIARHRAAALAERAAYRSLMARRTRPPR